MNKGEYVRLCLAEVLLMHTHNICFHGEIRKILCGYSILSQAMNKYLEEGLSKNKYIFFKSTVCQRSVGFTKKMINYEIPYTM